MYSTKSLPGDPAELQPAPLVRHWSRSLNYSDEDTGRYFYKYQLPLGAVQKRRLYSAVRGRGFFRCGRRHFLVQKPWDFFEIHGVSARTREGGPFFAI